MPQAAAMLSILPENGIIQTAVIPVEDGGYVTRQHRNWQWPVWVWYDQRAWINLL